MSKPKLSRRQTQILEFIRQSIAGRGFPPSIREIGEAVGLSSSSTVYSHLVQMQRKGVIRRDPSKPRSIELLDRKPQFTGTPRTPYVRALEEVARLARLELDQVLLSKDDLELALDFAEQARTEELQGVAA